MSVEIKRMWINQPSLLQDLHHLHGKNVIAHKECEGMFQIFFLSGPVVSMQVPSRVLCNGWRPINKH